MIDISLKDQQKIVDEIKAELDKQEEIKSKIENERNKIDEIIKQLNKKLLSKRECNIFCVN